MDGELGGEGQVAGRHVGTRGPKGICVAAIVGLDQARRLRSGS